TSSRPTWVLAAPPRAAALRRPWQRKRIDICTLDNMQGLSQSFRALGDPTRLRILRLLAEAPLNVSELVSLVGVAQPSVSHQLSRLRRLGLGREERQAAFTYYSLALDSKDGRWPLIELAREQDDGNGDRARLKDLLREREDRQALNEKLLEPGQSWFLWAR